MKRCLLFTVCCFVLVGCSSLGLTNEDSGHAVLASDVSVPANGDVVFTVSRRPNMNPEARQYYQDMRVNRTATSWFGFGAGPASGNAGNVKTHGDK